MRRGTCKCGVVLTEENCSPSDLKVLRGEVVASRGLTCRACHKKSWDRGRQNNPKRTMFQSIKSRCKTETGLEFTITMEDIPDIPKFCPVFPWIELVYEVGVGKARHCSPSLDRIDNTKGYIPGNIRIISLRANRLKSDAEHRELIALTEDAKNPKRNKPNRKKKPPVEIVTEEELIVYSERPVLNLKAEQIVRTTIVHPAQEIKIPRPPVIKGRLIWDKPNQTWLHPETLQPLT